MIQRIHGIRGLAFRGLLAGGLLGTGAGLTGIVVDGLALPASAQEASQFAATTEYRQVVDRGIAYLMSQAEADGGALARQNGTGVTSLGLSAILAHRPESITQPTVVSMLKFLESNIRPDGGIYAEGSRHRNYETCLAITALSQANRDGRYAEVLSKAEGFIKGIQWDQGEGIESSDTAFGGAGYGSHNRPDLSNTSFMIEALRGLGRGADDEAIQKALVFVSRTQNLESAANDTPHASKVNDGGFYYTPAAGGESQAGVNPDGGLRSYGSMTYAGLKSMIYAGVDKDDPRVKAAMKFLSANYTLEQNPGMGAAGLYYYYQTFAKALSATGVDEFVDSEGKAHPWREDLLAKLKSTQSPDGSWVNMENPRWMEGERALVTGYALLALAACK